MLILYKHTIRKKGTSLHIRLNIKNAQILLGMPSSKLEAAIIIMFANAYWL